MTTTKTRGKTKGSVGRPTKVEKTGSPIVRLYTQEKRAAFVRKQMRAQELSILELAEKTGHCWTTIAKFSGLHHTPSKTPHITTCVNIFKALGWNMIFEAGTKKAKGTVSIG